MLFKFIATAVLALGVAGCVIAINKLSGGRVPRWVLPVSIAAAIIGFQIFDEYNWFVRKSAALSENENYVIIDEFRAKKIWRPWTYINAPVSTIMAVNTDNFKPIEGAEGIMSNTIYTTGYLGRTQHLPFAFDCEEGRFGPYFGELADVNWAEMPEGAAAKLCK